MRINEYPRAISFNDGDVLLKDGSDGTKAIPFSDAAASLLESVLAPTMHKNLYRGKYLGTSVTAAQKAAIQNGTFKDLYIGQLVVKIGLLPIWTISTILAVLLLRSTIL